MNIREYVEKFGQFNEEQKFNRLQVVGNKFLMIELVYVKEADVIHENHMFLDGNGKVLKGQSYTLFNAKKLDYNEYMENIKFMENFLNTLTGFLNDIPEAIKQEEEVKPVVELKVKKKGVKNA